MGEAIEARALLAGGTRRAGPRAWTELARRAALGRSVGRWSRAGLGRGRELDWAAGFSWVGSGLGLVEFPFSLFFSISIQTQTQTQDNEFK